MPSVHPLTGIELRALRRLRREQKPGRYVFMSERGSDVGRCLSPNADAAWAGRQDAVRNPSAHVAAFNRFKLANQGVGTRSLQHYLGHKNIQHTVGYSELSPDRFRDFWKD
jgi:type 1 fimbriae regulatory protein FimB/type 1 fimbriae regulatory protein FimE